ncbi:MAG TPA: VWA domain-containing protein [Pyrinomonadaceae bacterium]|nr:VWA domain-containing protein [Pyrinomonadaceae bacterium]
MWGFLRVSVLIICSLFFTTAFGQRVAPRQNPQPTPRVEDKDVVKISTNLIQVDATVLDKNGKIVSGLTADDFEIYENNKKQQITNFSFVELQPDRSTDAAITVKPNKNAPSIPSVPGQLHPEQVHRTLALVVDDLGLSFGSMGAVKSALKKFVDEQMQPGDLVAIIRTSKGSGVSQQFTSDKRMLYAAIEKLRWYPAGRAGISVFQSVDPSDFGAAGSATAAQNPRTPPEIIEMENRSTAETVASQKQFSEFRQDIFAVGTLGAVNYVVKGIRDLPGRKAVVLFSDGFGLYDLDNGIKKPNPRLMDNFQRLAELANRSSVIIYTIDARGMVVPMVDAQDSFEDFIRSGSRVVDQFGADRSTELYETQQGLKALAEQTGGFAVINNNDLGKGIERVLNDQKGYYLLGYRPDSETFDPKKARFHKLTVKLKRPELHVRYRSGFFGVKDEDMSSAPKTPRQQILTALTSPFSSGDIDLRLTSLFASDAQTGTFMRSLVYVDGGGLKFSEEADGWQEATFDIVSVIVGDNGTVVDEVSRTETIKAKGDILREIREKGFVATITVPIKKPGGYQLRVVMRDTATSRIGSANQFIEVPNLKENHLALSGIVIERYGAKKPEETSSTKQFQSDEERDNARRYFHGGDTIRFDFSTYNAKTDKATKPHLVMQYIVYRDGKEIFISPEKDLNASQQSNLQSIDTSGVFDLGKKMPPGDYVLQVIVKDLLVGEKGQIATQWTDFEIIP